MLRGTFPSGWVSLWILYMDKPPSYYEFIDLTEQPENKASLKEWEIILLAYQKYVRSSDEYRESV